MGFINWSRSQCRFTLSWFWFRTWLPPPGTPQWRCSWCCPQTTSPSRGSGVVNNHKTVRLRRPDYPLSPRQSLQRAANGRSPSSEASSLLKNNAISSFLPRSIMGKYHNVSRNLQVWSDRVTFEDVCESFRSNKYLALDFHVWNSPINSTSWGQTEIKS